MSGLRLTITVVGEELRREGGIARRCVLENLVNKLIDRSESV